MHNAVLCASPPGTGEIVGATIHGRKRPWLTKYPASGREGCGVLGVLGER